MVGKQAVIVLTAALWLHQHDLVSNQGYQSVCCPALNAGHDNVKGHPRQVLQSVPDQNMV